MSCRVPVLTARRILVVEDEPDIRDLMKELLESSLTDVEVETAPDGLAGLRALDSGAFHVIITDFKMPGMNGLDFLQGARAKQPEATRVLMTAFPDLDIAVRSINEAHIENFFSKPLEPDEVLAKIERILDVQQAQRARDAAFARSARILAEKLGTKPPE